MILWPKAAKTRKQVSDKHNQTSECSTAPARPKERLSRLSGEERGGLKFPQQMPPDLVLTTQGKDLSRKARGQPKAYPETSKAFLCCYGNRINSLMDILRGRILKA